MKLIASQLNLTHGTKKKQKIKKLKAKNRYSSENI